MVAYVCSSFLSVNSASVWEHHSTDAFAACLAPLWSAAVEVAMCRAQLAVEEQHAEELQAAAEREAQHSEAQVCVPGRA